MMIKFRAWDKKYKRYYYDIGFFRNPCDKRIYLFQEVEGHINKWDRPEDEIIIEQYTGVNDKNDKEVYSGDIVFSKQWKPTRMEVVFNRGGFCLKEGDESCYYPDIKYAEDMEVIGTVHENKEELK